MMFVTAESVTVASPQTKAIVRFNRESFKSYLNLDGLSEIEALSSGSQKLVAFIDEMKSNGLIEYLSQRGPAFNIPRIRANFERLDNAAKGVILNPPGLPTININEHCKFKCPHCYNDTNQNRVTEMDAESIISKVLEPLAKMGGANVMWSGGDPVLSKNKTLYLTRIASSLGMSVATQAAEHSAEFIRKFAAAGGRGIQFSIYSSPDRPDIDDKFRGRKGSWEMTYKNIVDARAAGLSVFINMVLFPENTEEFEETADFVYGLGVDTFRATIPVPTGRAAENVRSLGFDIDQLKELTTKALQLRDRYSSDMRVLTDISECGNPVAMPYSLCNAGMTYAHVAGYHVYPCNFMMDETFSLGSIRDRPFDEIWRFSPKLEPFRTVSPVHEKCRKCTKRQSFETECTDCKAVMWMRYGAFLNAETPICETRQVFSNQVLS